MKSKSPFRLAWKAAQADSIWRQPALANEFSYLKTICADNLIERLDDITKPLERAADLSITGCGEIGRALQKAERFESISRLDQYCLSETQMKQCPNQFEGLKTCNKQILADWSNLCPGTLEENSYDLIFSNLSLHWVNDINEAFKQIRKALKPDGVFMGTMFGGDTLHELRASLAIAEQEREGGVSPHISPMLPMADACSLLGAAGLKLVTVDTAQIQIECESAFSLMRNLWWMGEGNACANKRMHVSRETMLAASALYEHLYGFLDDQGKLVVPASFSVIFMIGWAPHESQKAPLLPGEGQVSLTKLGKGGSG